MYRTVASIIVVCFFIIIAIGSASKPTPEEKASANYGPYPSNYQDIIKNYYSNSLFDPYSAVYKFLSPKKGSHSTIGGHYFGYLICGTVNAKNRFGAYVGQQAFFVVINSGKIIFHETKWQARDVCKQIY